MKKIYLIICILLYSHIITIAQPVKLNIAQTVAFTLLKSKNITFNKIELAYKKSDTNGTPYYYVFNADNGFVIVSGDYAAIPIFGYSNEKKFNAPINEADTLIGNNFWGWMKNYENQLDSIRYLHLQPSKEISIQWNQLISGTFQSSNQTVGPLLTTSWGQGWPYNALCPNGASGGCVAVAMAQIMKYYNYPAQGLGYYGYTWGSYPYTGANFGQTNYNFISMPNSISTMSTPGDSAVARIIYHAAVSCRAMWGGGNTGVGWQEGFGLDGFWETQPMTKAFVNYFKMAFSSIKYLKIGNSGALDTILKTELDESRPIYYRGYSGSTGHAWVCDGYNTSNMYHFNWGWYGSYNGYFALSNLNPGYYNFNNDNSLIIGIKPNDGSTIVQDTTWSGNIIKSTHIAVPDAITLTVNPGSEIKFDSACKLQVFGRLLSIGNDTSYVRYTALDTTKGWDGIKWDNFYMNGEILVDNDTSKLIYSQVEYSKSSGLYVMGDPWNNLYPKMIIDHCKINYNYSATYGGGIRFSYSAINITNSKIYGNKAEVGAGGIFFNNDNDIATQISYNELFDNIAENGGGFYIFAKDKFIISHNIIRNNHAYYGSGGLLSGGSYNFNSNIITNNVALNYDTLTNNYTGGGGLWIESCTPKITNNLFTNNSSGYASAMVICNRINQDTFIIANNTIAYNSTTRYMSSGGAIIISEDGRNGTGAYPNPTFINNIIYNNYNKYVYANWEFDSISFILSIGNQPYFIKNNIHGGKSSIQYWNGNGLYDTSRYINNIDSIPNFVNSPNGAGFSYNGLLANFQLQPQSPCINMGDTSGIGNFFFGMDLANNSRFNDTIDLGAYEYQGCHAVPVSISVIPSSNSACPGSSVNYTASPVNGGSTPSFQWKFNGINVGINSPTYSTIPINGDTISCVLTSNHGCTTGNPAISNAIIMNVDTVLPVSLNIICSANPVCSGSVVTFKAIPINEGSSPLYQWYLNGIAVGFNSSTFSSIPANGDTISCTLISNLSCSVNNPGISNNIIMNVNTNQPVSVSINSSSNLVYPGTSVNFTATPVNGGANPYYQWKKNGNTIINNSPSYSFIPINGDIISCVLYSNISCNTGNPATSNSIIINVDTVVPASVSIVASTNPFCSGDSVVFNAFSENGGPNPYYQWKKNGTSTGTNSPYFSIIPDNNDVISCVLTSSYSSATNNPATSNAITMIKHSIPDSAGLISGLTNLCYSGFGISQNYSVPLINNATSYIWTVPISNSLSYSTITTANNYIHISLFGILYQYNSFNRNITVQGTNECGTGNASTLVLHINPPIGNLGTISGTTTVCQGQNNVTYTVPAIDCGDIYYQWSFPQGVTSNYSNSNSINVNFTENAISGNISVTAINLNTNEYSNISNLYINVNPLPNIAGIISGYNSVCQSQNSVTYTIPIISNATSYSWSLPNGAFGSSSTSSISVNYGGSAVSDSISAKGVNACGVGSSSSLAVTVNPLPLAAGTISGLTTICQGQSTVTYTVPSIANASNYIWSLLTGVNGTSTTNTITVNYSTSAVSGNITVKGNNSCGDGVSSMLPITVNPLPFAAGTILGTATVCQGQNALAYTVPVIANASSYIWTLPSGASGTSTTNTITVNFGTSAVSGNITVKGNNSCGDGVSSILPITVNQIPQTPVVTQIGDTLLSNAIIDNQWYNLISGIINNATATTYLPQQIGDYFVIVTLNGCSSDSSNIIHFDNTGINMIYENKSIKVYPNPVNNLINVEIYSDLIGSDYTITDQIGRIVLRGKFISVNSAIQISNLASGIYLFNIGNNAKQTFKVLKN